jgi:hypothetical protein
MHCNTSHLAAHTLRLIPQPAAHLCYSQRTYCYPLQRHFPIPTGRLLNLRPDIAACEQLIGKIVFVLYQMRPPLTGLVGL